VSHSDAKIPLKTRVIESEEARVFALPGGLLFFSSGLIVRTETEAELAGVMAHEIAHITARHGTRQARRGAITKWSSIPLISLGGAYGLCTRLAPSAALPVGYLPVARGFEKEADLLGLQFVYKAGYDPNGLVDIFERLHSGEQPEPESTTRRTWDKLQELLQPKPEYVATTSEFNEVKRRLTVASRPAKEARPPSLRERR
jgi:predicted Zn-dependent protease